MVGLEVVTASDASRPKRKYHTKAKTGCQTCRWTVIQSDFSPHVGSYTNFTSIRKVRCDEVKPACTRCISTDRKCDGYTSTSSSTPSQSFSLQPYHRPEATADLKLILPRQSLDEVRGYRYFLKITAPSLAGAFCSEFWLTDRCNHLARCSQPGLCTRGLCEEWPRLAEFVFTEAVQFIHSLPYRVVVAETCGSVEGACY